MKNFFSVSTIRSHTSPGFTILETLFAIVIFSLALVSLMAIAGRGISTTRSAAEELIASYLNQEGVEVVRWVRDDNFIKGNPWLQGLDGTGGANCLSPSTCEVSFDTVGLPVIASCSGACNSLYELDGRYTTDPSAGTPSPFVRTVTITPSGDGEAIITARTTWQSKTIRRNVEFQTTIKKWGSS